MMPVRLLLVFLCLLLAGFSAQAAGPSVAFYYGVNPPLADLQAFDIAVVEPAHVADPRPHARSAKDGVHELFAYVALGEVQPSRPYYARLPKTILRTDNPAWGSKVIDQAAPQWREFFLSQVIAPLWEQGWRGFFLDTLDSYQLFCKTDAERAVQVKAMADTLRELKRRYPAARLMLNRGFELLPEIAPLTYALAAESLYEGFDAGKNAYRPVPEQDRLWLTGQMKIARDQYKLPVIAIDYVAPTRPDARALARKTAQRISADGFIPWVADGGLQSIGVGAVEVVPRTVLVVVDTANKIDLHLTEAQRFLGAQLNYLGLRYEFLDLANMPLPTAPLVGRYAGIVSWFEGRVERPAYGDWLAARIDEGVRVVVFERFGFALDPALAKTLGLKSFKAARPEKLTVHSQNKDFIGLETQPYPQRDMLLPVLLEEGKGKSLLQLADQRGNRYDAAGLTQWGGFVLAPFAIAKSQLAQYASWVLNPQKFLLTALGLPPIAVPDVTTEAGRRILMAHIDGDAFASRAELPGTPFSGEVIMKEILERYRIPTTVSMVEAETGPQGLYPELSPKLEAIARKIFALPYVEGASHSFSHPFYWARAQRDSDRGILASASDATLPVKNYRFDITREIKGSMDYINTRLMPKGKTSAVFLWSGDSVPTPAMIAETYRHGFLNLNGGESAIDPNVASWTTLTANGLRKEGWYQVFAPNQNENVYTNNWNGPFYGYQNVLATYEVAETPLRFKPVDIYYHFYSGTKQASLEALHKVYRWAVAQPYAHLYASQYIRKVLDFENTSIARDAASGDLVVRTGGNLRTLRLPLAVAGPSLLASSGVAGITPGPSGAYLTLAASEVRLRGQALARLPVHVHEASGALSDWNRSGNQLQFTLTSNGRAGFSLAQADRCSVLANGKPLVSHATGSILPGQASLGGIRRYDIGPPPKGDSVTSKHRIEVNCRA